MNFWVWWSKKFFVTKKFRPHLLADFLAGHRPFPATKLILKFQKYRKFLYLGVNFVTLFSKMRFLSKFASKTFKIKMVFIYFWNIYDKLKFWLFQIFPRQNRPYNRNVTCAGENNLILKYLIIFFWTFIYFFFLSLLIFCFFFVEKNINKTPRMCMDSRKDSASSVDYANNNSSSIIVT